MKNNPVGTRRKIAEQVKFTRDQQIKTNPEETRRKDAEKKMLQRDQQFFF